VRAGLLPYAGAMTPLFPLSTLELLADEQPLLRLAYGEYCRESASVIVADRVGAYAWLGVNDAGVAIPVVAAPRRAVMIAEQLAKRAYLNPDAIVAEGSIGPIGGDRTVEDFARTFELTEAEDAYLETLAVAAGTSAKANRLGSIGIEVTTPMLVGDTTIWVPDLDPRAEAWPIGTEGVDDWAYAPVEP
jgi:hypothetical protein